MRARKVEARPYKLADAAELLKRRINTKFNETVELAIKSGVDPKHSDQVVRGPWDCRTDWAKTVRVLVMRAAIKSVSAGSGRRFRRRRRDCAEDHGRLGQITTR